MNLISKFSRRLRALFRPGKLQREMNEEMRFHLEMQETENRADGLPPEEARYAALRSFGGVDQAQAASRPHRTVVWLEDFLQDLRHGLWLMRKNPGFTAVAVLTLALGIGANTAIFSTANAILFRPLPFPDSGRLVAISAVNSQGQLTQLSPGDFLEARDQARSFESLAFLGNSAQSSLTGSGEPLSVAVQFVSANFFSTLGVRPEIGRIFRSDEDERGKATVVVLSHGFWEREFGGRPGILNQTITLDGRPLTVIGVMPKTFTYEVSEAGGVDLWIPAVVSRTTHGARYFPVVLGRLKPGVSLAQVQGEMSIIAGRLARQFPDNDKGFGASVRGLLQDYVGDLRPEIFTLLAAVGFLLLICCVNLANLLLARALSRQKEIVIRVALGAGRGRIIRQLLTESLLLAACGGIGGVLLAAWGTRLMVTYATPSPRLDEISVDGAALAFTFGLALLTGLAFGLGPALQATRVDLNDALKAGTRGSTKGGRKARSLLVISEIALALVLLVGAGLFIHSLIQLQHFNPGFQPQNALMAEVSLPRRKYRTPAQQAGFLNQMVARLATIPGIQAVGATRNLPLVGTNYQSFALPGSPVTDPTKLPIAVATDITPGYPKAMGIPLLQGRIFSERDAAGAPPVALINEALARRYFGGASPIGQRIGLMTGAAQPDHWDEIVGVVGNVKAESLRDEPNVAQLYEPMAQWPAQDFNCVVRTSGDVAGLPEAIRAAIHAVDNDQPVAVIEPMTAVVEHAFSSTNSTVFLFSVFSGVGLGLAAIGIYGVMAYFVTQRTIEIGIRMALGAQRSDVLFLIFGQAARLVGLGLLVGVAGALALTQFLQSLLFGIRAHDPITFIAVAALLALVALGACLIPAVRAMRVTPVVALRYE